MRRTVLPLAFTAMVAATGLFGATSAARADPPWARGGYGEFRGGPPAWAPAHGWRRKMERRMDRWDDDRPYRTMRYREERRSYYRD
ncbi:hypothetical protein DA075_14960 [Methylobacterium currus]|uniref:Uncharacterized protein n=1 Tax=Methylobacterium currus TaxID=2051553 RepID=A0A2R4WKI4_9HYPH|nr:hypothetical protein [Methylobacterium currus]AWB22061.1 hypothetical protein DA075_14960 [Methylobacterium currus]UHC18319.1 hypothetical protein LRS73_10985 [Methylobacterium currus]